ncbi:hypothetical protein N7448_005738 [Penicillium atrosanguineum]|nr:hypothetical protein N7448_005738 [Penicillium atrosanguineum]
MEHPLKFLKLNYSPFSACQVSGPIYQRLSYTDKNGIAQPLDISPYIPFHSSHICLESGKLRFFAPQDPHVIGGIQDANKHSPLCIPTDEYPIPDGISEDYLFLDMYSPTQAYSASKPLLVFVCILGGGYNENGDANYNGTGLIQASNMGIMLVTFNYRVRPYGFLASVEVVEDGIRIMAQKIRLRSWNGCNNILGRLFGGDPNHVVVRGSNAGAGFITLLLTTYGGRNDGLFYAIAAGSQSFAATNTINQSQFAYDNLVIRTGCARSTNTLNCLRNLDAGTL